MSYSIFASGRGCSSINQIFGQEAYLGEASTDLSPSHGGVGGFSFLNDSSRSFNVFPSTALQGFPFTGASTPHFKDVSSTVTTALAVSRISRAINTQIRYRGSICTTRRLEVEIYVFVVVFVATGH